MEIVAPLVAKSSGEISLPPVANAAIGLMSLFTPRRWAVSTTRLRPTIWLSLAYAQLIDSAVCVAKRVDATADAFGDVERRLRVPGLGSEHGSVPSMVSLGCTPAWSAASRMNSLADEPVWRGVTARLTCDWSNPRPPTMATTAPVLASSAASAAWNRPPVSGS